VFSSSILSPLEELSTRGCTKRPGELVGEDEAAWRNVVQ
jgi:hypothetical protein